MGSGDTDPRQQPAQPHDAIATRLQRASAAQAKQASADLNTQTPTLQYSKEGLRFYDTAPRPLRRLLGSPLAQVGKYARGPNSERLIGGGWGDSRNFSYAPGTNTNSRHTGIDYFAPKREPVLACADGVVTFVGYQKRVGSAVVNGAKADKDQNILDSKGAFVAPRNEVGHGGIIVFVVHNGDFQGYRTEYMHLDEAVVNNGAKVTEGQIVGYVGITGSSQGPHLHFQIAYVAGKSSATVNPTALVPNYWPNHIDSTNAAGARGVILPPLATAGMQVANSQAANTVNGLDRATSMQNQDLATMRANQAAHAQRIAQTVDVQQAALYAAAAGFQGQSPVVGSPMVFDFTTGTWSDGKVV